MADSSAKQRLVSLAVGEVSVVDHPANEEEFLVIKSAQAEADERAKAAWTGAQINELPDSAFLYVEPGGTKDSDGKTTPRDLRHFPYRGADGKVDLPHLRNALARIPQSTIPPSMKDKLTQEAQRILAGEDKSAATTKNNQEPSNMSTPTAAVATPEQNAQLDAIVKGVKEFETELVKAKADPKPAPGPDSTGGTNMPPWMKKAQELFSQLKTLLGKEKADIAAPVVAPTAAVADMAKALATVEMMADGSVVVKGKSQFSKERVDALKAALSNLAGLLKETDPAGYTQMMQSMGVSGSVIAAPTIKAKIDDVPVPLVLPTELTEMLKGIQTSLTGIDTRLKTVEKSALPSRALPEGGTDAPPTADKPLDPNARIEKGKPTPAGFWKGTI